MEKIKLPFRGRLVELECANSEEISALAQKYNERLSPHATNMQVSDAKLALITGIKMEHEIEQLKAVKNTESSTEDLIETFEHLSMYLNSLAQKLESSWFTN